MYHCKVNSPDKKAGNSLHFGNHLSQVKYKSVQTLTYVGITLKFK